MAPSNKRWYLRLGLLLLTGLALAAVACGTDTEVVKETVVVEKEVAGETVVETVVVEKEKRVEVPVTVEVEREKVVEVEKEKAVEVQVTPTPFLPGQGETVRPARATWNTGYFQEAVYSLALQDLGFEVEDHKELDNPLFYQSVAQGDVDFWANGWFPLHNQYQDTFTQGAEIAGTVASAGALQGYLVNKSAAEEFGISTLADFKKEDVRAAFDTDGNGKANLVACPEGWGCNGVIGHHLDDLGLRDYIDEGTAGYSASMADAISRYNNGENILFYTWTPNWTVNQLKPGEDVVWIGVPEASHPDEGVTQDDMNVSGVAGAANDPLLMGFPANDINVVANSEFLDNNPAAAKLFEVVSIPLDEIFRQNNRMKAGENTQEDIDRHAKEFKAAREDLWAEWLEAARDAAR